MGGVHTTAGFACGGERGRCKERWEDKKGRIVSGWLGKTRAGEATATSLSKLGYNAKRERGVYYFYLVSSR